jgi:large subunit ribosomal protein L11
MNKGDPCPVVITYYQDKSFTFEIKTPPASFLIKKAAKMPTVKKPGSGSKKPGVDLVGKITMAQCKDIAKAKQKDLNAADLDQAAKMIAGTARSMGVEVVE